MLHLFGIYNVGLDCCQVENYFQFKYFDFQPINYFYSLNAVEQEVQRIGILVNGGQRFGLRTLRLCPFHAANHQLQ